MLDAPSKDDSPRGALFVFGAGGGLIVLFALTLASGAFKGFDFEGDFFGPMMSHCLVALFSCHLEPQLSQMRRRPYGPPYPLMCSSGWSQSAGALIHFNMSLTFRIALVDIVVRATIVEAAGSNFEIRSRKGQSWKSRKRAKEERSNATGPDLDQQTHA